MKTEKVWPYVLPFPLDAEKRRLIWSILQSRVGISILRRLKTDSHPYQRSPPTSSNTAWKESPPRKEESG